MQSLKMRCIHRLPASRMWPAILLISMSPALGSCVAHAQQANGATATAPAAPILTEQNLHALQQANVYGASLFHVQPPGPDFVRQMRIALPRDYAGIDQGFRLGLANIERDLPYLAGYFANKNSQQLAAFVQDYHAKITAPKDPVEQQVLLAEVMSFVALTSYRQHQNGTSARNANQQQQMEALKYKQLQRAVRSYSPLCGPGSTDPSCHP